LNNLKTLLSSQDMTWETPKDFFDNIDNEFHFTLDPCATPETAKCKKFYTKEDDGLKQDWTGEIVFCNPPYGSEIKNWVEKCSKENAKVVMLIPARTDTKYFHEFIYQKPDVEIRFIKGRLKFGGKQKGSAPFPSMLVIFNL
jgi:phage N-6-adenine-methyltransferase